MSSRIIKGNILKSVLGFIKSTIVQKQKKKDELFKERNGRKCSSAFWASKNFLPKL